MDQLFRRYDANNPKLTNMRTVLLLTVPLHCQVIWEAGWVSGDGLVNPTKDDEDDDEYFTGAPRPLTVEVR